MFVLKNGSLSMDNHDLDHIIGWVEEENYSPKEALATELEDAGFNIKDVFSIELKSSQMQNESYVEIYSKLVCDFWNNKDS